MSEKEIYDFGFSLTDEDEIKKYERDQVNQKTSELTASQLKLQGLKNMIWPLLESLKANPTKTHVLWPDRVAKINEFQKKIEEYIAEVK